MLRCIMEEFPMSHEDRIYKWRGIAIKHQRYRVKMKGLYAENIDMRGLVQSVKGEVTKAEFRSTTER